MHYQAATDGPGALAYVNEAGYPDSTKGAEVLYRGTRGPSGWDSTQLSPAILAPNEQISPASGSGSVQWLSDDLSCGFAESFSPQTPDPAMNLVREYGGSNLYRINPDSSYTAVTNLAPENPDRPAAASYYAVTGASQDCGKVTFETPYRYPGIPGTDTSSRLYEWDEGTLRNVGFVPGPSGEVVVEARREAALTRHIPEHGLRRRLAHLLQRRAADQPQPGRGRHGRRSSCAKTAPPAATSRSRRPRPRTKAPPTSGPPPTAPRSSSPPTPA